MARTFRSLGLALARAAWDKKGDDIALLDVRRQSPISDYILIATVLSAPHLAALEDAVRKAAKELLFPCLHRARPESYRWRVLDFGGLLVHLMTEDSRSFYALEKLYDDAKRVRWEAVGKSSHLPKGTPHSRTPHA